jgi:hypothetical protein
VFVRAQLKCHLGWCAVPHVRHGERVLIVISGLPGT